MASNRNLAGFIKKANQTKVNLVHFFNPIDKGSSMPSWYYTAQMEHEEEDIARAQNQLKRNLVPQDKIERLRVELRAKEKRLEKIREAQKKVKTEIMKDKDGAVKRFKQLEADIADSMPTRDEMHHKPKLVDPRLEADRLPHRSALIKEYKILGHFLGEYVIVEALRR